MEEGSRGWGDDSFGKTLRCLDGTQEVSWSLSASAHMHACNLSLTLIHTHTHTRGGDSISRIIYLHASTWEPITPSLRRLKQGDPEFEAQLG